jgi:hypothetical protein
MDPVLIIEKLMIQASKSMTGFYGAFMRNGAVYDSHIGAITPPVSSIVKRHPRRWHFSLLLFLT